MITLKILEPYRINVDEYRIQINLEDQCFAIQIGEGEYQFVPAEAKEILINRKTQKIENTEAKFAFQSGEDMIYIAMIELIYHPDFLIQLHSIARPYYHEDIPVEGMDTHDVELIIDELEQKNIKNLIDKALDERNPEQFYELVKLL